MCQKISEDFFMEFNVYVQAAHPNATNPTKVRGKDKKSPLELK